MSENEEGEKVTDGKQFADTTGLELLHIYNTFFAHNLMFKVQLLFNKPQLHFFSQIFICFFFKKYHKTYHALVTEVLFFCE